MYFIEGLNQREIANLLNISRPQISRLITQAKEEGIITIKIKDPFKEESILEEKIKEKYPIKDVSVSNIQGLSMDASRKQIASLAAEMLEKYVHDGDTIGIMAGKSVRSIANEVDASFEKKDLQFVPLIGGWGADGADWHANFNARSFGERMKMKYYILNAPAALKTVEARIGLLKEPNIKEVLKKGENCDVAMIGIGQLSINASVVKAGFISEEEIEVLKKNGAVASVCTFFIDNKGNIIEAEHIANFIGTDLRHERKKKTIIAIAYGQDKIEAIKAALNGGWIDVLVTDLETAKNII